MDIFQKAFNRKRNKRYQSGGEPINKLAGTEEKGYPECAFHFTSAQKFYETGDLNKSLCAVNKAIELSPVDDWKQYAFKANILGALKMFQEAINAYEKAIEINSDDVKVYALYNQIGFAYLFLKNNEKAVEFYSYALELKQQHPNTPPDIDIEDIENGILLGKKWELIHLNRGNSYFLLGQHKEAEKDCFRALEINPEYSMPCLLLYYLYGTTGQKEKAVDFLKKAVVLGNTNAQKALNDLYSAFHAKTNFLTADESAEVKECLHVTFEQHDLTEGKRLALNLINKGVKDDLPYLCLASIYKAEKNWKECEEIAKAGLKLNDDDRMFLNLAGVAICHQGRISEGLQYLEKRAIEGFAKCSENYEFWKSAENNQETKKIVV